MYEYGDYEDPAWLRKYIDIQWKDEEPEEIYLINREKSI